MTKSKKKCIYLTLSERQYERLVEAVEQMGQATMPEAAEWNRLWEHLQNRRRERIVPATSKSC